METLIIAEAGSHLYGLNHAESDRDTMGIGLMTFEQATGLNPPDQTGESDHVVYELKKWVKLAAKGNPTILQMLWVPQPKWQIHEVRWARIQQELKPLVLNQSCRQSFLGYLQQQRKNMITGRGQRHELKSQFGYDVKTAMHAVRLGLQGFEVLTTGQMSLPMQGQPQIICQAIRAGKWEYSAVLEFLLALEDDLKFCPSDLPAEPDWPTINQWLTATYQDWWGM